MLTSAIIRVFYLALMFIAGLVLSNIALPGNFGTISLIILNASLLTIVTSLGADTMVIYKVSNHKWGAGKAVRFTWMAIAIQIILFVLLQLGSLLVLHVTLLSNEGPAFLLLDTAYFIGLLLTEKYLVLLYAFHRARLANMLLACGGLLYLVLLLIVYYLKSLGMQTIMWLFAGQSFVQGLLLLILFYRIQMPSEKELLPLNEFLSLIKLSSLVMVTNFIQLLAYRLDFWLIQFFWGKYDVGIFAQANKFANLCWLIPNIFAQLLQPKFAGFEKRQAQQVFNAAFYTNVILALLSAACAHLFYAFYLKPDYSAGLMAFYMMLPGYFFWASVIYFGSFVSASGKFSYNLICSSACFVIVFLADIILIPLYGFDGAALANTISYTTIFFVYLYILNKKYSLNLKDLLWPGKNILSSISKFVVR